MLWWKMMLIAERILLIVTGKLLCIIHRYKISRLVSVMETQCILVRGWK
jgi:hypothetical protein